MVMAMVGREVGPGAHRSIWAMKAMVVAMVGQER
jgi:hypothetical protein